MAPTPSGPRTTSGVNSSGVGDAQRRSRRRRAGTSSGTSDRPADPDPVRERSSTRPARNPRFFWMPSIAMNGQGHASLNASTAGNGHRAEVAGSGRLATDPLGTTEAFDLIQSSNNGYNLGSSAPRRWGDFSQTVVDPTDDQTFWTFQEYTSAQNVLGSAGHPAEGAAARRPSGRLARPGPDRHRPASRGRSPASRPAAPGSSTPTDPGRRIPTTSHITATVDERRRRSTA